MFLYRLATQIAVTVAKILRRTVPVLQLIHGCQLMSTCFYIVLQLKLRSQSLKIQHWRFLASSLFIGGSWRLRTSRCVIANGHHHCSGLCWRRCSCRYVTFSWRPSWITVWRQHGCCKVTVVVIVIVNYDVIVLILDKQGFVVACKTTIYYTA